MKFLFIWVHKQKPESHERAGTSGHKPDEPLNFDMPQFDNYYKKDGTDEKAVTVFGAQFAQIRKDHRHKKTFENAIG